MNCGLKVAAGNIGATTCVTRRIKLDTAFGPYAGCNADQEQTAGLGNGAVCSVL